MALHENRALAGAPADIDDLHETSRSGVSWGAIFAGAVGAAALSLILLLLGTGLGFSSISPWAGDGASAKVIGGAAIAWLTFTQVAASGLGGYLAGRLRTKWAGIHTDEVYFRDTAHGFLAWGVATLVTAAMLTSAIGSIVGAGAKAGASLAGGAAATAAVPAAGAMGALGNAGSASSDAGSSSSPMSYFVDSLFRRDAAATPASTDATAARPAPSDTSAMTAEVTRIFVNALRTGSLPQDDARYVAAQVTDRTGLSQADAEKRVNDIFAKAQATLKDAEAKARDAADTARKASAYGALWLFISMLIGAFVASLAATYGGHRRDL